MKRLLILISSLLSTSLSAQYQRLAVLPAAMQYTASASTLCVDYFRDIPKASDRFTKVISASAEDKAKLGSFSGRGTGTYQNMSILSGGGGGGRVGNRSHFIVGSASDDQLPGYYSDFVSQSINSFRNKKFGKIEHQELQKMIWQFDILDKLGYVEHSGNVSEAYRKGKNLFKSDFFPLENSTLSFDYYGSIADDLKFIKLANQAHGESYKRLLINFNRSTGQYVVFNGPGKPIYRGSSEASMLQHISSIVSNDDNVYVSMTNFGTVDKERAVINTLQTKSNMQGKNIFFERAPSSKLFFEPANHKLVKRIGASDIKIERVSGTDFFTTDFSFTSTRLTRLENNNILFRSSVKAFSNYRELITRFANRINSRFTSFADNTSLVYELNSIRKYVKGTMGLNSDAELWLQFKAEGEQTIWVNVLHQDQSELISKK